MVNDHRQTHHTQSLVATLPRCSRTPFWMSLIGRASEIAARLGRSRVTSTHVFLSALDVRPSKPIGQLETLGISFERIYAWLSPSAPSATQEPSEFWWDVEYLVMGTFTDALLFARSQPKLFHVLMFCLSRPYLPPYGIVQAAVSRAVSFDEVVNVMCGLISPDAQEAVRNYYRSVHQTTLTITNLRPIESPESLGPPEQWCPNWGD